MNLNISIISDQRKYEFITSQQYKTTMKLGIKYDNTREGIFFIPVEDRLTDIEVHDSKGRQLTQLSPQELEERFNISMTDVSSKTNIFHKDDFIRIAVLLLPSDSEFEILTITFVSPLDPERYSTSNKSLNMKMSFGLRISPSEFTIDSQKYVIEKKPYDLHITFSVGDDYKIQSNYNIEVKPQENSKIVTPSKKTPNLVKFHVTDMDFESDVVGNVIIGIADSTANTAAAISVAGILVPILLVFGQIAIGDLFLPTLEILGGVIAVLIGSRILVIQEKYIMKRWIGLYHIVLALNAVAFTSWFIVWMMINFRTF